MDVGVQLDRRQAGHGVGAPHEAVRQWDSGAWHLWNCIKFGRLARLQFADVGQAVASACWFS
jgi:hypothetical protein